MNPLTQYEALQNKTVKVKDIKNRSYEKEENLYVDKVVLQVEDREIPKGKITINPEITETEIDLRETDGVKNKNEKPKDRDPTVRELFNEFPRIKQLFKAIEDFGEIEISGLIRAIRDSSDDEWNFFIRTSELDKLEASKVSQDSQSSTAQDFVEDQTNIETENSEESGEKEILFDKE